MRKIIVSILSLLVGMSMINAQDLPNYITAADFSYECLGNNKQYKIKMDIYTECNNSGDLGAVSSFPINVKSTKLGAEWKFNLIKKEADKAGERIKIFCEQRLTNCETTGGDRGLRKFHYEGVLDLTAYTVSDDWELTWQRNLRSYVLASTLLDVTEEPYRAEILINNKDVTCNSSPVFNSSKGPIVKACISEETVYPLNVSDSEGDEIRLALVSPQATDGVSTLFKTGFSFLKPVSVSKNVSINSSNELVVNATTADQQGITDVKVSEYRNGKLIGSITRGLQISTFDCNNEKPKFLGFNGGENEVSLCAGDTIRESSDIFLKGTDVDGHKTRFRVLSFSRRGSLSSVPFPVTEPYSDTALLYFNWLIQARDTGVYDLKVVLEDNGCPTPRSVEETYVVKIIPLPLFELGEDIVFECNKDVTLKPNAIIEAKPATYSWYTKSAQGNNEVSTADSLLVTEPNEYFVRITDAVGCKAVDNVTVKKSLEVNFDWEKYCLGLPTILQDSSFTNIGTIVRHEWVIEDETQQFTKDTIEYTFPNEKEYKVTLKVENSVGCIEEKTQVVHICGPKEVKISVIDSCTRSSGEKDFWASFVDATNHALQCQAELRNWTLLKGGAIVGEGQFNEVGAKFYAETPGLYQIKLRVDSKSGCKDSTLKDVNIVPRTEFDLLQSATVYQECNKTDTILKALINKTHSGKAPYTFNGNAIGLEDTLKISANKTGKYTFLIQNADGCEYQQSIDYIFPLNVGFKYDTVCALGNEMKFINQTNSNFPISKYEWRFGDEGVSLSRDTNFIFNKSEDYSVRLKVTDNTGCSDSLEVMVYNTVPSPDSIQLLPNVFNQRICVNDIVRVTSPNFQNSTRSLDTIKWNKGKGLEVYTGFNLRAGEVLEFPFSSQDKVKILNEISYNYDPVNGLGNHCFRSYERRDTIEVLPEFNGEIIDNRLCSGDSAIFKFDRNVNIQVPIVSWEWKFYKSGTFTPYDSSNLKEPHIFTSEDLLAGNLQKRIRIRLRAQDSVGCVYDNYIQLGEINDRRGFATINVKPKGWLKIDGKCASEAVKIEFHSFKEDGIDEYYGVDFGNNDTILFSPEFEGTPGTTMLKSTNYIFNRNGDQTVYFYKSGELEDEFGKKKECRSVFDTVFKLAPRPIVKATVDTVCARLPVQLKNGTTIPSGNVVSYEWKIGENIYTEDNPIITLPKGGLNQVLLKTVTDSNCTAYDTLNLFAQYSPIAKFSVDGNILEANTPIDFKDESVFNSSEPDSMWFDFGDGTIDIALLSNTVYATHTFDDVKVYNVTHVVSNKEGCKDTVTTPTDLNTYLDIPTAFSPNGDDNNDELALIYKSIRELYEFKIYNRWGEKVFDAEGNLDKKWDGTFRDSDQPYGVYVVHIKALGAYDIEFNIKKNITLLR